MLYNYINCNDLCGLINYPFGLLYSHIDHRHIQHPHVWIWYMWIILNTQTDRVTFWVTVRSKPNKNWKMFVLGVMQDLINNIQKQPHLTQVIKGFLENLGLRRERAGMPGNMLNGYFYIFISLSVSLNWRSGEILNIPAFYYLTGSRSTFCAVTPIYGSCSMFLKDQEKNFSGTTLSST